MSNLSISGRKNLKRSLLKLEKNSPKQKFPQSPFKNSEGLGIDTLWIKPESSQWRNLLILISGVHGVEAPAGVFIQHQVLRKLINNPLKLETTGILIIHVINPYGAYHGRRFNEQNIDLNRNCFDDRNGFPGNSLENPEYEDLKKFFHSSFSYFNLLWAVLFHGTSKIRKALRGQYQYPQGIYFGGHQISDECRGVQSLLESLVPSFENIALFDFHTGLGEKGINQIMLSAQPRDKELDILRQLFPMRSVKISAKFKRFKIINLQRQGILSNGCMIASKKSARRGLFSPLLQR